jgi:hypothetical protein
VKNRRKIKSVSSALTWAGAVYLCVGSGYHHCIINQIQLFALLVAFRDGVRKVARSQYGIERSLLFSQIVLLTGKNTRVFSKLRQWAIATLIIQCRYHDEQLEKGSYEHDQLFGCFDDQVSISGIELMLNASDAECALSWLY